MTDGSGSPSARDLEASLSRVAVYRRPSGTQGEHPRDYLPSTSCPTASAASLCSVGTAWL